MPHILACTEATGVLISP